MKPQSGPTRRGPSEAPVGIAPSAILGNPYRLAIDTSPNALIWQGILAGSYCRRSQGVGAVSKVKLIMGGTPSMY